MDRKTLEQVGQAMHGEGWRRGLARDLNVNERTVRRWDAEETPIPAGVVADLQRIITQRIAVLAALVATLGNSLKR